MLPPHSLHTLHFCTLLFVQADAAAATLLTRAVPCAQIWHNWWCFLCSFRIPLICAGLKEEQPFDLTSNVATKLLDQRTWRSFSLSMSALNIYYVCATQNLLLLLRLIRFNTQVCSSIHPWKAIHSLSHLWLFQGLIIHSLLMLGFCYNTTRTLTNHFGYPSFPQVFC